MKGPLKDMGAILSVLGPIPAITRRFLGEDCISFAKNPIYDVVQPSIAERRTDVSNARLRDKSVGPYTDRG